MVGRLDAVDGATHEIDKSGRAIETFDPLAR
jgi:hypothetical protein